jgi:hypothetical protein
MGVGALLLCLSLGQVTDAEALARKQFAEAEASFERGDVRGAERLYLESFAVLRRAPIAWNIGRCAQLQGADATAIGWYRRYLQLKPDASDRAQVEASIAGLERRLADRKRQALTLFLAPPTATAQVDEQPTTVKDGESLELEPGVHRVLVSSPGFVSAQLELRLSLRASQELTVTLVPIAPPPPPVLEPDPIPARPALEPPLPPSAPAPATPTLTPRVKAPAESRFRIGLAGHIGIGVTAGALLLGAIATGVSWGNSATLLDGTVRMQNEADQLAAATRDWHGVATGAFIGGGVGLLFTLLALGFGW